jgi:hypothetical protein
VEISQSIPHRYAGQQESHPITTGKAPGSILIRFAADGRTSLYPCATGDTTVLWRRLLEVCEHLAEHPEIIGREVPRD